METASLILIVDTKQTIRIFIGTKSDIVKRQISVSEDNATYVDRQYMIENEGVWQVIQIGGPKLGYAFIADSTSLLLKSSKATKGLYITSGSVMIGIGNFLLAKA